MDANRNELLGALASDAGLERADFLVSSTDQLKRFLDANRDRIDAIGGLTLIDEDPDFLSIAPDLTFRSRTRFLDDATGEWVSETEIIETAAELVELYNPAELYAAFAEAARAAAGLAPEPTGAEDLLGVAHVQPSDGVGFDDAYAAAADQWAAGTEAGPEPDDDESAAQRLYDLALTFQERSQRSEASLLDDFAEVSARMSSVLGDVTVVDDDDERLILKAGAGFRAEVVPDDGTGEWRNLQSSDDLVEFYDPTDVFGDLADALAEAFPSVAPDFEAGDEDAGAAGGGDGAVPPSDPDGLGGLTRA